MQANLENLISIFARMRQDGFDTSKPLKWGFFFLDRSRENLQKVLEELDGHGYTIEGIRQTDDNHWQLHVSKTDTLTPEQLHKRNVAFDKLAEYCDVELYDGWDVEKAEG